MEYSNFEKNVIISMGYLFFIGVFVSAFLWCFYPSLSLFGTIIVCLVGNDTVVSIRNKGEF